MSVNGIISNGVVVLPPGSFPDGMEVVVSPAQVTAAVDPSEPTLYDSVKHLIKDRPHLPDDYALNHGHYVRGEPKR